MLKGLAMAKIKKQKNVSKAKPNTPKDVSKAKIGNQKDVPKKRSKPSAWSIVKVILFFVVAFVIMGWALQLASEKARITAQQKEQATQQQIAQEKFKQELLAAIKPVADNAQFEIENSSDSRVNVAVKMPLNLLNGQLASDIGKNAVQQTVKFLLDKGKNPHGDFTSIDCKVYGVGEAADGQNSSKLFGTADYKYYNNSIAWYPE